MYEYKLLPVPDLAKKAKGRKTVAERFSFALSDVLNEQAKEGWEFSGQESFSLEEKGGMLGKDKKVKLRTLIFRREVRLDEMPLDQKLEKLRERKAETMVQAPPTPAPVPEPFPEPMPSPQAMGDSVVTNGAEPTRIFSPFDTEPEEPDVPPLGPAEKA